ncbi:MAG: 30S ribosomal protein S12 methylthiotransferase RimO [Ruminococcaceae bacterium]|nr:30S ribosomal protein S12 methylthiotransferase RimO [Oscillospiraceae bacterium]
MTENIKVSIVSLGCAKNRVDAEMMLYKLREAGFVLKDDPADGDAVIINTCGFIESAKQESIEEILELAKLKEEGKIKALIVSGCLAERYKEDIKKEMPEVDAVIGLGANGDIVEAVKKALAKEDFMSFPDKELMPLDDKRIGSTLPHYAYLKVADGCDNKCTYCAIPMIRGRFRSRTMESILAEAKELAERGVKELNVIAQDTTRYGEDIYGKLMLPELLKELCKIEGIEWIRVLYCYPDRITDELIDTIANEDKILKYIDLPLQHCNQRVLKAMNRRGSKESLKALINKIRERIPSVVLRTTLITGFPTETDEEFDELAEFAKEMKFERLGCFPYSTEEDTPAAELEQVDKDIRGYRADAIMRSQELVMEDYCQSRIGSTVKVLVEGFDRYAECFFGRSYADAPEVDPNVFFTSEDKVTIGEFVNVEISDYLECDLIGEVVK